MLVAVLTYLLLWGRLVPYSPLIVGFERKTLERATIYYHDRQALPESIDSIGEYMSQLEALHALAINERSMFCFARQRTKKSGFAVPQLGRSLSLFMAESWFRTDCVGRHWRVISRLQSF